MDKKGASSSHSVVIEERSKVIQESEATQLEKGDSLPVGVVASLPDIGKLDFEQNDLAILKQVWQQMRRTEDFAKKYGLIAFLIQVQPHIPMLKAMLHFWDPSFRCFTFQNFDMTPTLEEYYKLINVELPSKEKVYYSDPKKSPKRILSKILGVQTSEIQNHMKEKGLSLNAHYLLQFAQNHVDTDYGLSAFALAIYGLILFPRVKGQIDGQVIKLFEQIEHNANPAIPILAETIRSLNHCRLNQKGRFHGCAQLLTIWMISHLPIPRSFNFPKMGWNLYRPGFHNPVREFGNAEWPLELPKKSQWIDFFLSINEVVWRAPWMPHTYAVYRCGSKPWVPLIGPWGITSYAPAMVRRQLGSKQFIPMTHDLSDFEFSYGDEGSAQKVKEATEAWKDARYVKQGSSTGTTPGYPLWQAQRGKGFTAPKICGPDPPLHNFNEPIDYIAEAEGKYEVMYRLLKKKEVEANNILHEKKTWSNKLQSAMEELQSEKRKSAWMEQEMQSWINGCETLEASLKEKDMQLASLNHKNKSLQLQVNSLNSRLKANDQVVSQLRMEKAYLETDVAYWKDKSQYFEGQHQDLLQKSCNFLNDIQEISKKARKRAREAEEAEIEVPPIGKAREFLVNIKKELDYIGSFY